MATRKNNCCKGFQKTYLVEVVLHNLDMNDRATEKFGKMLKLSIFLTFYARVTLLNN